MRRKGLSRSCAPGCAALAPPGPQWRPDWVSENETQQGMPRMTIYKGLKVVAGAVLLAAAIWGVLAAPGFLSDQDSTVTVVQTREAFR